MKILKNKKFWIITIILLIIIISIVICLLIWNRETRNLIESTYTMYLVDDADKLLEIEFSESFYECTKRNVTSVCSDVTRKIIDVRVLNDTSFNYDNLSLEDIIINYINTLDNDDIEELLIISNYDFKELLDEVKNNVSIDIYFDYEEDVNSVNLDVIYYTITFDTNGGSSIDSIVVKENDTIALPEEPVRDGYNFVGWFVGDDEYNFEELVKSNLTLTAKWEKESTSSSGSASSSSSSNNTNKINLNSNLSATLYTKSTGSQNCFFYVYATNLESVYPSVEYGSYNGINDATLCPGTREYCLDTEFVLTDFSNSSINYNISRENALESALKKYDNTPGFNLISFVNDNHKISFEYEYITFNGLNVEDGTNANKEIQNLLKGSYLIKGPCGGYDMTENVTVDEAMCEEFNLNCDRW